MKKNKLLIILFALVLIVTGCNKKEEDTNKVDNNSTTVEDKSNASSTKILTCTANKTDELGSTIEAVYKVTYKDEYVDLIETEEKVTSDNSQVLDYYKEAIESIYLPYKDLEHYDYNVIKKGNQVISTTKIDYSNIDTDKMIEINSAMKSLIKDGKMKISDVKSLYESSQIGATCE